MMKKMSVDIKKSLGYQANGRLSPDDKVEKASLSLKKFLCPECKHEIEINKEEFGEAKRCPLCDTVMVQQY